MHISMILKKYTCILYSANIKESEYRVNSTIIRCENMAKTYINGLEVLRVEEDAHIPEGYTLQNDSIVEPFEYTLSIIEGKWKMKIIYALANTDVMRYGELKRALSPITHKMLSAQLKELEKDGIVVRNEYKQIPPKVEYCLSPKGDDMLEIFREMWIWGHKHQA